MKRVTIVAPAAVLCLLTACIPGTTESSEFVLLGSAFNSIPVGFDEVQSSFVSAADSAGNGGPGGPWMPGGRGGRGHGGPGMGGLMGGGMGPGFLGDIGVGHGFGRGPFGNAGVDSTCVYSAATGDVTCAPVTRNGITVTRIASYKTSSGVAQAKPDSTTNYARVRTTATGTRIRRDSATAVVNHTSDRTVTGLAVGSASRTVNGTSSGTENTTGTSTGGTFTSVRIAGDTVKALIIPLQDGKPTYPTSGSVTRHSKVTVTIAGGTPEVSDRREVITYNGTASATLVITENGVTKNCTVALPHGRPSCQ
ncbi:MAG: hypothetical protein H7Z40_18235 [Phycisphaerae bacterium]|nr:hypothetical protein [Gemmatimonadaceae bacterium]